MNIDLEQERLKATFSIHVITHLLDGGHHRTKRRRQLEAMIARDPTGIFSNHDNAYLHRTDRHIRSLAKHVRLIELCRILGIGENEEEDDHNEDKDNNKNKNKKKNNNIDKNGDLLQSRDFPLLLAALGDDLPTSLHWVMFVPNIISLFDDEQQKQWLPLCRDWKVVGCYAQTELGHVRTRSVCTCYMFDFCKNICLVCLLACLVWFGLVWAEAETPGQGAGQNQKPP